MTIQLKKFGTSLISRQDGREAFLAYSPTLAAVKPDERVVVDFDGIITFTPSWGAEFLGLLSEKFGDRLTLKRSDNLSVILSLETIEEAHKYHLKVV
ncbi:hypothetical protein A2856_00535 [Candidatus Uhrbacteria bacterium RIFCSPHIGHO2_01_FULL_63_20]|uniref:Uncharacterized protein n=1 Tax=Candidatus Uhrbacteria bacterium RIFCSPHIGHO2_01_FULL_63_20 TaxID=1802385 RepID=A0A1F7TLW0_9BACT|nr:MAG: hypothetical protein A2856_00535 [Candidatus Uhrbacteria bacterium RIFCSPHIGHO2_01_FULL_63_20]